MDGGIHNSLSPPFWGSECPSKITIFCWLACEEKILTLTNLAMRGCKIQNATDTCVLCHEGSKTADHLLLKCIFATCIWAFSRQTLNLHSQPVSLSEVWTYWLPSLDVQLRDLQDLLLRATFWNILLERNNQIFNLHALPLHSVIVKFIHMLLTWVSAARDPHQLLPSDSIQNLKRSLIFLS